MTFPLKESENSRISSADFIYTVKKYVLYKFHLKGNKKDYPWESILRDNIVDCSVSMNVLELSRNNHVIARR